MLTRVSDFATTNVSLLPKTSPGEEFQKTLASDVNALDEFFSARISAETVMGSAWKDRAAAREVLKVFLMLAGRKH